MAKKKGYIELQFRVCKPLTQERVRAVCKQITNEALSQADACAIVGVNEKELNAACVGVNAPHPEWLEWLDEAKAKAKRHWLRKLAEAGVLKSSASVNAAKHMLEAIDERFKREKDKVQTGLQVQIIQGKDQGSLGEAIQVKVIAPEQLAEAKTEAGK